MNEKQSKTPKGPKVKSKKTKIKVHYHDGEKCLTKNCSKHEKIWQSNTDISFK